MSLRSTSSNVLARAMLTNHRKRLRRGRPLSLSIGTWKVLPDGVKEWLRRRVLVPSEESAWQEIERDKVLAGLTIRRQNSWAISPASVIMLWHHLLRTRPRRIVEFGSGVSTRLFARYAAMMANSDIEVRVLSIEHDKDWCEATLSQLDGEDERPLVELVHAPLSEQRLLAKDMVAYTIDPKVLSDAAGDAGFDLCMIDGPPGSVGRAGCLPLVANVLNDKAVVMLDDAYRPGEQAVLDQWRLHYPGQITRSRMMLADSHGTAVFQWLKSNPAQQ